MIPNNQNLLNLRNQNHPFPQVMIGDYPIVMSGAVVRVAVEILSNILFINLKGNFK